MDQAQWLAHFDERLDYVTRRAHAASERLGQVGGTAISPRGEVSVRVGAGGALEDLSLTPAARALEADELARLILDTTRQAQRAVGAQLADIATEYFGDGPAVDVIKRYLPAGVPDITQ